MACATAGTPSGNATPRGTSSAGTSSTTGNAVTVELKEWSIAASPGSASAGAVSFTTRNSGTTPHDLVVIKTDVAPDKLETDSSGAVDESKYTVGGKITQLDAGKSQVLSATVQQGSYVLICNVPGHYALGMHTAFSVK